MLYLVRHLCCVYCCHGSLPAWWKSACLLLKMPDARSNEQPWRMTVRSEQYRTSMLDFLGVKSNFFSPKAVSQNILDKWVRLLFLKSWLKVGNIPSVHSIRLLLLCSIFQNASHGDIWKVFLILAWIHLTMRKENFRG